MRSSWAHYLATCQQLDLAFPRWTRAMQYQHHCQLSRLSDNEQDAYVEELIMMKHRRQTILYLCDGRACPLESCDEQNCHHTSDITHAKHFKKVGPSRFVEIEEDRHDV